MKKSILALAIVATVSTGACAQQPSVNVYGVVDAYLARDSGSNPAGPTTAIDSAAQSLSGSRLGFRGKEELGGRLAAIFTAEMGFGTDTGNFDATGNGFGRQAFVGLQGDFGTLKLGRQYNPLFNGGYKYDPFAAGMEGYYSRLISLGAGKRLNNAIDYSTPKNLGGFNAEAAYSVGEVAGSSAAGRVIALTTGYERGPFSGNLTYNNTNSIPALAGGAIVTTRNYGVGASYDFGVLKASGLVQSNRSDAAVALDTRDFLLGVKAPFGASAVVLSYIRHENRAAANATTKEIALGYTYGLSKRSILYSSYARIANDIGANLQTPANFGGTARQFNAGINHSF
jgi:predicted porin